MPLLLHAFLLENVKIFEHWREDFANACRLCFLCSLVYGITEIGGKISALQILGMRKLYFFRW